MLNLCPCLNVSIQGYDPDNFDRLIKRKYWEVISEKDKDVKEKEQLEIGMKRKRIIMTTIKAINEIKRP